MAIVFDYCVSHPRVLEALALIFALISTLLVLARALPWQNVITASALVALLSGIVETVGLKTGVPFGHFNYARDFGPRWFGVLPWAVPCLWVVALLNSRGVARLILRPWRGCPNQGLRMLGLTGLLMGMFEAALEPFAVRVNYYWTWHTSGSRGLWYGAPWMNFVGWAFASVLIMVLITPWLIDKKQQADSTADFYPLLIWVIFNLVMAIADALHGLGGAALFTVAATTGVAFLAWMNAVAWKASS